ncbi:MAG: hypothetical protein AAF518_17455 [Spirochaetota bacterium]
MKYIGIFLISLAMFHCSSSKEQKRQKKLEKLKKVCLQQGGTWIEEQKSCKLSL